MTRPFPDTPDFSGHNAPSRIECDIFDLVVEGELPAEIEGAWYRSIPDPQFPPMLGDDTYLSGDGMVSVFRIGKGHADFSMRYVRTDRWRNERAARRSLHGLYRNPFTDDPSVRGKGRGAANTTPIYHAGRLLAAKEDSRAWEVDPATLETLGEWDYHGKLRSATMTPHPRIDPDTGEMYFFGYEASGLASRDVAYCVANRDGELVREDWFEVPYCALMHDFAVTQEHAIFPVFPITADLARLRAGGPHWAWEGHRDSFVGIMPRDGRVGQMRWFRGPPCSAFHYMNAFTQGSRVHLDFSVTSVPVFEFIRAASTPPVGVEQLTGEIVRWTFDLSKPGDGIERTTLAPAGDLMRIADRHAMRDYEIGYYGRIMLGEGPPLQSGPVGPGFNALSRLEVRSGRMTTLTMDARSTLQEAVHIPSRSPGHEGYLAFLVDRHDSNLTEAFIVEAERLERGPIARLMIPLRLRCGVHGTWVAAR
ncbi:MAG: carotenoid oxygenase family protein [Steroidobacteraceae bacterium]